jgi:heptosyltransferase-3
MSCGFVPQKPQTGWFKRYFLTRWLEFDVDKTHTVLEILRLCQLLAIEPVYELTAPQSNLPSFKNLDLTDNYAVLHIMPQWRYKQWTTTGWLAVAHYLSEQGLQVVLSGSDQPYELAYLHEITAGLPSGSLNLAGKLSLAQLAEVIANARLFIGVDTGITHLAAATGVKIIALFGPSDPVKWAPWPSHYHSQQPPFVTKGCQQVNNVILIQGAQECVPCYLEGCERHRQSYSTCLDSIQVEQVETAIAALLQRDRQFSPKKFPTTARCG